MADSVSAKPKIPTRLSRAIDYIGKKTYKVIVVEAAIAGASLTIISLWDRIFPEPKFHFFTEGVTDGDISINRFNYKIIILSGGISNSGSKPLFPIAFSLKVKFVNWEDEILYASHALTDSLKKSFGAGDFIGATALKSNKL